MKTKFFITALSIFFYSFTSMAQKPHGHGERGQERRENIESMKIAFITQKVDLTPAEAQVFWPVYNQYTERMQDLRKKRKMDKREAKLSAEELTDKEVEQEVDNEIIFKQKELDIQKEYHAKFKSILPIKKVARLYAAEDQFKQVLLDKLKNRERDHKPGR